MIFETNFKNVKAVQLENEHIKIVVLPENGGKLASIFLKKKEFELVFQNKQNEYKNTEIYDVFSDFDASGFDDAFPSINVCNVKIGDKEVVYPDHGEIWSGNFSCNIVEEKIKLFYKSSILPYSYKKLITILNNQVILQYEIINTGDLDFPCIWAAHFLVNCHENMELIMPENTKDIINVTTSNYLGEIGETHFYPITEDYFGKKYFLDRVYPKSAKKAEKYYIDQEISEGECGIYYPHRDVTYKLSFDKSIMPYIGFWVTEGGFRGDYNCALEPTNGFYDGIDIASREKKIFILKATQTLKFKIKIEIK